MCFALCTALLGLLCICQAADEGPTLPRKITCEGQYRSHLQGIAGNRKDALYWSFTDTLVKTDLSGRVLARASVKSHHGDLCYHKGLVYVAYSNTFNKPGADSKVFIYDAADLSPVGVKDIPEVTYGAGGIEAHNGRFYVIGGLPKEHTQNFVYEYDAQFRHLATHTIDSGYTNLGIQTICFHEGFWWLGCYTVSGERRKGLLKTTEDFTLLADYNISPSVGIVSWGKAGLLVAQHFGEKWHARAVQARTDDEVGLVFD